MWNPVQCAKEPGSSVTHPSAREQANRPQSWLWTMSQGQPPLLCSQEFLENPDIGNNPHMKEPLWKSRYQEAPAHYWNKKCMYEFRHPGVSKRKSLHPGVSKKKKKIFFLHHPLPKVAQLWAKGDLPQPITSPVGEREIIWVNSYLPQFFRRWPKELISLLFLPK